MKKPVSRSQFKTMNPLKEIPQDNLGFLYILVKIQSGELEEGVISYLPNNEGELYINHFKISNIFEKHGQIPLENMIITATEPTSVIRV